MSRKKSDWTFRLQSMSEKWQPFFITLTYKNKHITQNAYGDFIINREHLTLFFKRLRENLYRKYDVDRKSLKYFFVPEYGPQTCRPHYHGFIYISRDFLSKFDNPSTLNKFYNNLKLEIWRSWGKCTFLNYRFSIVQDTTSAVKSSGYVAKYLTYGKFLPLSMYKKANSCFNYELIYERLGISYEAVQKFAIDNQHNIDSLLESLDFSRFGGLEFAFLTKVGWPYKSFNYFVKTKDELRDFYLWIKGVRRGWFKVHYPAPFICCSTGIGVDILSSSLKECWDRVLMTLYQNVTCKTVLNISDEDIKHIVQNLFKIRSFSGKVHSVPQYIRELYKKTSLIGSCFSNVMDDVFGTGMLDFNKDTTCIVSEIEDVSCSSIYDSPQYIEYKSQTNVFL